MLQVATFQNLFTFKNSPDHYILIVKGELNHVSRRERAGAEDLEPVTGRAQPGTFQNH